MAERSVVKRGGFLTRAGRITVVISFSKRGKKGASVQMERLTQTEPREAPRNKSRCRHKQLGRRGAEVLCGSFYRSGAPLPPAATGETEEGGTGDS